MGCKQSALSQTAQQNLSNNEHVSLHQNPEVHYAPETVALVSDLLTSLGYEMNSQTLAPGPSPVPSAPPVEDDNSIIKFDGISNVIIREFITSAIDVVTCPICKKEYNDTTCQPCTLPCGHTCCMSHTGGLYCPICSHRRQVKVRPTPSLALQDSIQALKTILDMLKVAENFYNIEDDNTDIYQEYAYCKNEVTTRLNRVGNPNIRDALDKALGSIECSVCFERFGSESTTPCTLPCGHSYCLHVAQNLQSCPICRAEVTNPKTRSITLDETARKLRIATEMLMIIDRD